jgi:hypothetical protein
MNESNQQGLDVGIDLYIYCVCGPGYVPAPTDPESQGAHAFIGRHPVVGRALLERGGPPDFGRKAPIAPPGRGLCKLY